MQEIVICSNCEGYGYITRHEITDYHKRDYDVIKSTCYKCKGTGKLTKTTTITYKPFLDDLSITRV